MLTIPNEPDITNLLTIDVEEWFHTTALAPYVNRNQWHELESQVEKNVQLILRILEEHRAHATFFVLGWVAERYPFLVREIATSGHEIASHGYQHQLIYQLTPETFRDYVRRSKQILEDITGTAISGYRATSFSVVKSTLWALDIIKEAGFIYDSSMFPISHDIYGIDGIPVTPFIHPNGLIEIPPSTVPILGRNMPIAGGGYFRLYPYWLTRKGIQWLNQTGRPAVVYLHPWELDPACPKITWADWRTRFRQYVNLSKTESSLKKLLRDFKFSSAQEYLQTTDLFTPPIQQNDERELRK
jgi:polysaccharide deacetylase family protein (PEP-CTERM system associated)